MQPGPRAALRWTSPPRRRSAYIWLSPVVSVDVKSYSRWTRCQISGTVCSFNGQRVVHGCRQGRLLRLQRQERKGYRSFFIFHRLFILLAVAIDKCGRLSQPSWLRLRIIIIVIVTCFSERHKCRIEIAMAWLYDLRTELLHCVQRECCTVCTN